jgi:uncharacterized phage protein (TIGR02218 family)
VRTIGVDLAAHLAENAHTLATMLRFDLANGDVLAFTDHDDELTFNLGDGSASYAPWSGINASAVVLSSGFEVSNFEVTGPIGSTVTRAQILGGRFRNAVARLFIVNWSDLTQGAVQVMRGRVAGTRCEASRFVLEVRNVAAVFNQSQGNVLSPWCRADFGVEATGCPVVRTPVACTVTAVTDAFEFAVDIDGDYDDNKWFLGTVAFLTGELAGTAEFKVFASDGSSGGLELFEPLPQAPQVGDTLNLYTGCSRLLKHENPIIPTCLSYGAVEDFRGEPEVPGNRTYQRVSAPGSTYD